MRKQAETGSQAHGESGVLQLTMTDVASVRLILKFEHQTVPSSLVVHRSFIKKHPFCPLTFIPFFFLFAARLDQRVCHEPEGRSKK
jgi:hypothetical protein